MTWPWGLLSDFARVTSGLNQETSYYSPSRSFRCPSGFIRWHRKGNDPAAVLARWDEKVAVPLEASVDLDIKLYGSFRTVVQVFLCESCPSQVKVATIKTGGGREFKVNVEITEC